MSHDRARGFAEAAKQFTRLYDVCASLLAASVHLFASYIPMVSISRKLSLLRFPLSCAYGVLLKVLALVAVWRTKRRSPGDLLIPTESPACGPVFPRSSLRMQSFLSLSMPSHLKILKGRALDVSYLQFRTAN